MDTPANNLDAASGAQIGFDSIKLDSGALVQLEHSSHPGQKYNVRYIGAIKGKSILLSLPVVEGRVVLMPPGQSYIIRGFNGKYAYAFTSRVIQARSRPFNYVHFSWPASVESKIVRKVLRINMNLPVLVDSEGEQTSVTMVDLSAKGTMLDSSKSIGDVGNAVNVQFDIAVDGVKTRLTLPAKIRNAKYSKDASSIHVGVEFENVSQNDMLRLNNFILTTAVDA